MFSSLCFSYLLQVLSLDSKIQEISKSVFEKKSLLVLGRGYNYATCLEGALVSGWGETYHVARHSHRSLSHVDLDACKAVICVRTRINPQCEFSSSSYSSM